MSTSIDPLARLRADLAHAPTDIPRAATPKVRRRAVLIAAGVITLVGGTLALRGLKAAAPTVERSNVWMDTVRMGPMVRDVPGQGTLVPEEVRWIAARANARVERILVKPGAVVTPDTVLLELSNSDLQLQALEAARQLAQGEAELVNLRANLNSQVLGQRSAMTTLDSELSDARRRARADEELASKGFLSDLELGQTKGRATELKSRLRFEKQRLGVQRKGIAAQVRASKAQVDRLRSIAEFRRKEVADLTLRAGFAGVLQVLNLQPGQPVAAGTLLAKIANPDHLKAEIRVPETQAKDVKIGQKASIDTRNGVIPGHVLRVDPVAQGGTVLVDIALDGPLPPGARPDLNVEGTIEIERLASTLYIGRPASGQPGATIGLFKLDPDGSGASRVTVKLGGMSVKNVQILGGLNEGDRAILSDLSQWDRFDRIRLR